MDKHFFSCSNISHAIAICFFSPMFLMSSLNIKVESYKIWIFLHFLLLYVIKDNNVPPYLRLKCRSVFLRCMNPT
jgi:hypothetical protein